MNPGNPFAVVRAQAETPAERASRLQAEAKAAASDQLDTVQTIIASLIAACGEVSGGGEAYPPGARDLCSRLAVNLDWQRKTLESIVRGVS